MTPSNYSNPNDQKRAIRQEVRRRRQSLSAEQRQASGIRLAEKCLALEEFQKAQRIACFLSNDGEIPTEPLLNTLLQAGKACYLPKLKPLSPNQLWMMPFDNQTTLKANRFGIPEPDLLPNHACPLSKLDILFMPLVAFDAQGHRLGMGGGFYDRTLAHLRHTKQKPTIIGLAFECQRVDRLPVESWDIPLDWICTEASCVRF